MLYHFLNLEREGLPFGEISFFVADLEILVLGVVPFGDLGVSLPEEHKLQFPLLSDPNHNVCGRCGAMTWKEEVISCCGKGDFAVPRLSPLSDDAVDMTCSMSHSFLKNQRELNSLFAFTALGASPSGCWHGPPPPSMLTTHGKAYRRIFDAEIQYAGEAQPPSNTNARFYVYDNEQTTHGESLGLFIEHCC